MGKDGPESIFQNAFTPSSPSGVGALRSGAMPQSQLTPLDQAVLDLIEHSPVGAVPRTPTYDESIHRLLQAQQVYHSSDHRDGFVTARSLARLPLFVPNGLLELAGHPDDLSLLESNNSVFDRYVASLPLGPRVKAEGFRLVVAGKPVLHRHKSGGTLVRDPLHSIFLVPGAGPQPGLPGNYLRGILDELHDPVEGARWRIQIMDTDTDASVCVFDTLAGALARLEEVLGCAPFHLAELETLGFTLR